MSAFAGTVLQMPPGLACAVVFTLVFLEDALFVGFVIPGETAAILGGALASTGRVSVWAMLASVVVAAIAGDTVGYAIGRRFGPRLLQARLLDRHRDRLGRAQDLLRHRGALAVVLGRFTAFFRAVMPALAGTAQMPYRSFLAFNAVGGTVWGSAAVLLGLAAGASYDAVARSAGAGAAVVTALAVLAALLLWRRRRRWAGERETAETP